MAEIILAKLQSGEEIIAKVVKEDDTTYTLNSARLLMVQHDQQGQMGVAMIPWMVGAPETDVILFKTMISGLVDGNLPKQLEDGYLQQTSGIQLAGMGSM